MNQVIRSAKLFGFGALASFVISMGQVSSAYAMTCVGESENGSAFAIKTAGADRAAFCVSSNCNEAKYARSASGEIRLALADGGRIDLKPDGEGQYAATIKTGGRREAALFICK